MRLLLLQPIPAIAWAKSLAENGARSSVPSPTPTKCTGNPYFAAIATRMPPRAVPSSFVIARPVTPAVYTAGVTGLAMTKLDGTARGGILVAIAAKYGLPVHFIGVGEGIDDLAPFSAKDFARAIAGIE